MFSHVNFICSFLFILAATESFAGEPVSAERKISSLSEKAEFRLGVSAWHLESGKKLSFQSDERHAMASVYKFPIALALLKDVENEKVSLDQKISISKLDILDGSKGPLAKKHPNGGVQLSVLTLLKYMVANSDNSACDLILKKIGGPKAVTNALIQWGYKKISVDRYERTLINGNDPGPDLLDTATAAELTKLVGNFWVGQILSKHHTTILKDFMTNPHTPGHIENGLPKGTPVFHKSGWCSSNQCINDSAIVRLPGNKGHIALTVLTSGPIKNPKLASQTIGDVARIVYDAALNNLAF